MSQPVREVKPEEIPGYMHVDFPQPHPGVTKTLLARHPEIRKLNGHTPWSFAAIVGLVSIQTATAAALSLSGAVCQKVSM